MIGITSCFRQWLTVVRLPRNHVKFTAEKSYEYRSALHRNHKLPNPFSWTSMVFCSKYFFQWRLPFEPVCAKSCSNLRLVLFRRNRIIHVHYCKKLNGPFFYGPKSGQNSWVRPLGSVVRSKYSAFICLHWFGSLPIPPASYQRIIRAEFGKNWLKPNENWTHDDPLRYSEKQVTDVHEKRVYQLTNSM